MYIHREEGKEGYEMISDPMDLPVGYNPNFDLLVKVIGLVSFVSLGSILMFANCSQLYDP